MIPFITLPYGYFLLQRAVRELDDCLFILFTFGDPIVCHIHRPILFTLFLISTGVATVGCCSGSCCDVIQRPRSMRPGRAAKFGYKSPVAMGTDRQSISSMWILSFIHSSEGLRFTICRFPSLTSKPIDPEFSLATDTYPCGTSSPMDEIRILFECHDEDKHLRRPLQLNTLDFRVIRLKQPVTYRSIYIRVYCHQWHRTRELLANVRGVTQWMR
ncbi:hypothetical protein TNCT_180471 [Trichonephila clavata]|uniref:Uncharacterized protein n=1 Tax=Trichonephila clavata TaxID=2740835 RepID=A0A8X6KLG1_TRICU|nr:hypothetical protein TNCT_180471 [Trichonephila clavata]